MAGKTFLFRITQEGVDELKQKLEALGPVGKAAFDKLAAATPGLGNSLDVARARVDLTRTKLESLSKTATDSSNVMSRYSGTIQQAGYQIGDFAVQIASGQDPMRAFIQQGTQLVSMFGPWGAVIGAAGASVGALGMAFLGIEDPTKKASAALDAFNKTMEHAVALQQGLRGELKLTRDAMEADARNTIAKQQKAYDEAAKALAAMPRTISYGVGEGGPAAMYESDNPEYLKAKKALANQLAQLLAVKATLGAYDDKFSHFGMDTSSIQIGVTKDTQRALDALLADMQKDAETAGLSGKAHAERVAILQAESAVQKDVAAHLRTEQNLTAAEIAVVIAAADAQYDRSQAIKDSAAAQRAAEQQAVAHTKATDDATRALLDQISGLQEETYQLGLSDRERYIRQQVIKAEQQVLRGAIENGNDYVAQVEREAGSQFDAADAIRKRTKADQDASRESEKQARIREQIAKREAELQLEPYKNAIQGIQSAWTDGWEKALSGQIGNFSDFFGEIKQLGIHWAAEMASLMTFRPIAGSVLGAVAPGLAASLGFTSSAHAAAIQNAGASGMGGGGFGSFAASAAPLASMFGGAGGATGGLGSWLFGAGTPILAGPMGFQVGTTGGGIFGAAPGLAGFLNSGLGTGLVGAVLSAGLTAASGGSWQQTAFSGGGSLIGGLAGSLFGQPLLGAAAGGFLGNILGGLFGGKEKKPPKQQSITDIMALSSGYFGAGDTYTKHSGDLTSGLGKNAANALNSFLASIGGTVNGALPGQNQLLYYGRTPRFMSIVGGANNQYGADEQGAQDAVADFIARTMVAAAKSSKLEGVSAAVRTAIANSGAKDADALDAAVAFGKFFDRVDQIRTPADSAAKAMADLAAQMSKAQAQAEDYGLDVAKLPEIFKANFIDGIQDQILQLTDPTQFALKQMEIEKAAAIAQATNLGADLNAVEELYGLKRKAIVEQGLQGIGSSFQDFFTSLLTDSSLSALSPQEQYKITKAAFEGASNDNLIAAASPFLQASRGMYASSKGYADDFRSVLERVKSAGGLTSDIPFFAKGGDFGGGWMVAGEMGPELIASGAARIFDAQTTAAIMAAANADLSPKTMATLLKAFGQGPDTELAHVMPAEIALLRAYGGAGTINPHTGLPEFRPTGSWGSGAASGGRVSGRLGNTGSGGRVGAGTSKGTQAAAKLGGKEYRGQRVAPNLAGPNPGDMAGGGIVGSNGYLGMGGVAGFQGSKYSNEHSSASDRGWAAYGTKEWNEQQQKVIDAVASGLSSTDITKAAEAYGFRLNDYTDRYNTFGEDVGNFLASLFGFNEMKPTLDFSNLNPNADWGFDPAGMLGGLAGMLVGMPGLGILIDKLSLAAGRPLEVPIGPTVFGADTEAGVANALAAQGAPNISLGSSTIEANKSGAPALGGTIASPGLSGHTLSSAVTGSGMKAGLERTSKTNTEMASDIKLLAELMRGTNDKLDRLLNAQAQTNDVLKVTARGTTKI